MNGMQAKEREERKGESRAARSSGMKAKEQEERKGESRAAGLTGRP